MTKVLFVVRGDATVPSCRFRAYQFEGPLSKLGVEAQYFVEGRRESPVDWVRTSFRLMREVARGGYDAVVYQKRLQRERVSLIRAFNSNVWYDFDDAVYLGHERRFGQTLKASAGVIAGNEELAAHARRHHSRVAIIPTVVEVPDIYTPPPKDGPLKISWVGTAGNLQYLEPVFAALDSIRGTGTDAVLHVLTDEPGSVSGRPGVVIEAWSKHAEEKALVDCHLGVMPLPDDDWARGKCACKALQYLSYGRPVISSPVGVNVSLFENEAFGSLATSVDDWASALTRWNGSREEIAKAGRLGREFVTENYDVCSWAMTLKTLLVG